jgi:hypothetical protein
MIKMRASIAIVVSFVAAAGVARADNKAQKFFDQGKKLLGEKKYADACAAFEQSAAIEPGIGVEMNIGRCYEEWGKLARAYRSYSKAEQMATTASDKRLDRIRERLQALDKLVPRLIVSAPEGGELAGVEVQLDGKPLDVGELGKEQLVDPGPHVVDYTVGGAKKSKSIPVERGAHASVVLDVPVREKRVVEPVVVRAEPSSGGGQRIAAYATAGGGIIAIGVSIGVGLAAKSSYSDALAQHCANSTAMCDPIGLQQTHDARSHADIATGVFIGGAVLVAGGVVLYLTAPHRKRASDASVYVAPSVGGVIVGGAF